MNTEKEVDYIANAVRKNGNGNYECLVFEDGSVCIQDYDGEIVSEYKNKSSAEKDWFIF